MGSGKNLLKKYPVVVTLALVCLLFAVVTSFYEGMYDLFAFHSRPVYFWQYFSGTFMHGSKGAPLWFLWVHLGMNYLMILPFGCVLEARVGSRNTFLVFVVSVILSSAVFQILLWGQDELACGVSAVGYGFVTGGLLNLRGLWRAYSRKKRVLYLGLSGIALVMLLPAITGWISTCLHLSGILSGLIVHFTAGRFSRET